MKNANDLSLSLSLQRLCLWHCPTQLNNETMTAIIKCVACNSFPSSWAGALTCCILLLPARAAFISFQCIFIFFLHIPPPSPFLSGHTFLSVHSFLPSHTHTHSLSPTQIPRWVGKPARASNHCTPVCRRVHSQSNTCAWAVWAWFHQSDRRSSSVSPATLSRNRLVHAGYGAQCSTGLTAQRAREYEQPARVTWPPCPWSHQFYLPPTGQGD